MFKKLHPLLTASLAFALGVLFCAFYIRAQTKADDCKANLGTIQVLKIRWAILINKPDSANVTWNDIRTDDGCNIRNMFHCPCGGVYTLGRVGEPAKCSFGSRNIISRHVINAHNFTRENTIVMLLRAKHLAEQKRFGN